MSVILKTLISSQHTSYLTSSLKHTLSQLPIIDIEPTIWIKNPYAFIDQIHTSWLTQEQLACYELIPNQPHFAKQHLWKTLQKQDLQPLCFVETEPLAPLLGCKKLTSLLHLLGLYDLSLDLKKIVRSDILKSIQNALTEKQITFLKQLSKKTTSVDFGTLDLAHWDKAPASLQNVLYRRGMNRLAKACTCASSSFIWYFQRQHEKNIIEPINALMKPLDNPTATKTLASELLITLEHL